MELRRLIADIRKSDAPLPIDEKSLFVGEGLEGNIPVLTSSRRNSLIRSSLLMIL